MVDKVVTRFPPSPTGFLHIGGVRTALFNHLFAAHNGGVMFLRFEDTDRERSKPEFEKDITEALAWLGIPYTLAQNPRQSERGEVYKKYIPKLIENRQAYEAEAQKDNPNKKVIRFKNPNKTIIFADAVRGTVSFHTAELGDFVIARSFDEPLYHLAVVIDDHEMGVTHVIRGEDHISNTPRQILILEALGFNRPEYAHIPLILTPDKTKLSKRHGAVSINEYRAMGFIPETMLNYLALLGWNPGGEQELFTLDELGTRFTLDRVHKNGAVFDIEKLRWFNHEHLKKLSDAEYASRLKEFAKQKVDPRLAPLLKERAATLKEAAELLDTEFGFMHTISYDVDLLCNHNRIAPAVVKKHLEKIKERMTHMQVGDSAPADIRSLFIDYADENGRGDVLWPMRVALSGKEKSPDPFTILMLLGEKESEKRIAQALQKL